jgi:uncharacterized Zn-binding protein involved in type VI secretion
MKKVVLIFTLIIALLMPLPLAGCGGYSNEELISMAKDWMQGYNENQEDSDEEEDSGADLGPVSLKLTYPAGRSPNVFTTGWVFGASCTADGEDYSDQVTWSGSGSFSPDNGNRSRPSFNSTGANTITLSVTIDDKPYSKSYTVNAVSPEGYACQGMSSKCAADAHGCPACPHTVIGPITTGSSQVLVQGKPAARQGDSGVHAACCDGNTYTITGGDSSVLINGRPAAKIGSATQHCGGTGKIVGWVYSSSSE